MHASVEQAIKNLLVSVIKSAPPDMRSTGGKGGEGCTEESEDKFAFVLS